MLRMSTQIIPERIFRRKTVLFTLVSVVNSDSRKKVQKSLSLDFIVHDRTADIVLNEK